MNNNDEGQELYLLWRLDEGKGTYIEDLSDYQNHGMIQCNLEVDWDQL